MINGILNIKKEAGFTSHDVVAKLRGIVKQKKIGHTGTLDPDAIGVLPVCLGKATKLCDLLTDKDKTYEAVILLGTVTDTQDTSGTILSTSDVKVTSEEVTQAVMSFVGESEQIPPMYSALKVNGKKLYELAREGKVIERKARPITIHDISILSMELEQNRLRIRVSCSKGTYIRTLCHDIGEKLGCGACMEHLTRTKVSIFTLEESHTLNEINEYVQNGTLSKVLIPIDHMFMQFPSIVVEEEQMKLLSNGNRITFTTLTDVKEGSIYRVYDSGGEFAALYEKTHGGEWKPYKMFR